MFFVSMCRKFWKNASVWEKIMQNGFLLDFGFRGKRYRTLMIKVVSKTFVRHAAFKQKPISVRWKERFHSQETDTRILLEYIFRLLGRHKQLCEVNEV